jgi:hypothetical protein
VGTIPDYALLPKGGPAATTIFYKRLVAPAPSGREAQ